MQIGKHGHEMNKTLEWGEDKEDELKKILDKFEKKKQVTQTVRTGLI